MPSKLSKSEDRIARQRAFTRYRAVNAYYDAAQTTVENRRHWAAADSLSAQAAHNPSVLKLLRTRSRYETANNSYARGLADTIANYVIGTGPRLQALTESDDINSLIESLWVKWSNEIDLAQKLRTMRVSQCESGEVFGLLATNPLLKNPIQLDIKIIEADQCTSPYIGYDAYKRDEVDGIIFDAFGNPSQYIFMKRHPGDMYYLPNEFESVSADLVLHLFRPLRPGQARGVPEFTPALALFAYLRRYTLAVLNAAEQAALITGIIHTDASANAEDADQVEAFEPTTIDRGTLLTMPHGWKVNQLKAEQPTTVYGDFKNHILNEIARCLNIPFNIAACNSSGYNYASGRLDHQAFFRSLEISRDEIASRVLEKLLGAFIEEAVASGLLPKPLLEDFSHQWFWDGFEHVDPAKEASAQDTRLGNHTTTYALEYAKQGLDWREQLKQRAIEIKMMEDLGIAEIAPQENGGFENEEEIG